MARRCSLAPEIACGLVKRHFKREAESDLGTGIVYLEFDDAWAMRQVENYGDRWFRSERDFHPELGPALCDQPLSELGLGSEHEITEVEFEQAWRHAAN